MGTQRFRWSKVYESSEEELVAFLQARNIHATRFMSDVSGEQVRQTAEADSTIWCAEGSFVIHVGSTKISLQPGDAVRIDAGATYNLHAGISGFVYYLSS